MLPPSSTFSSPTKALRTLAVPIALSLALATSMASAQSINTVPGWNGTSFISSFGIPNTATYGQTITAPATPATLRAFDFRIQPQGFVVPFKLYVYEWDAANSRATGDQLFVSGLITTEAVSEYRTYGVSGLNIALVPGKQYVLFASVSETQGENSGTRWASTDDSAYAGGRFVFINNGTNVSGWTESGWSNIASDLVFTADIKSAAVTPKPVPTLSQWSTLLVSGVLAVAGMMGMAGAVRRRS